MLGPLCDQVDKRYSFVKHNKVLKKNALSTMARRIATEITWTGYPTKNIFIFLIFVSYMGCMPYTFVHFGGFLCIKDAGRRGNKTTVLIFSLSSWSLFCKISHERHKWNTFHIHVLNSTTNLTLIHKSYLWLWEWSCGFDRKESWSE